MSSERIKTQKNETKLRIGDNSLQAIADPYSNGRHFVSMKRATTCKHMFKKKMDYKFAKYFNMNRSQFASVIYHSFCRLYKVVRITTKCFQSLFKVFVAA